MHLYFQEPFWIPCEIYNRDEVHKLPQLGLRRKPPAPRWRVKCRTWQESRISANAYSYWLFTLSRRSARAFQYGRLPFLSQYLLKFSMVVSGPDMRILILGSSGGFLPGVRFFFSTRCFFEVVLSEKPSFSASSANSSLMTAGFFFGRSVKSAEVSG